MTAPQLLLQQFRRGLTSAVAVSVELCSKLIYMTVALWLCGSSVLFFCGVYVVVVYVVFVHVVFVFRITLARSPGVVRTVWTIILAVALVHG